MIKNSEPLSISEVEEYVSQDTESNSEILGFIKKFKKLSSKDAKELKKKLQELDLLKMKAEHIPKIIDLLPEDSGDLNKIFVDVSLDDEETKKILDAIKEFK